MTTPIDMIKTRLMLQRESKRVGNYKNGLHCAYQVYDLRTFPLPLYLASKNIIYMQNSILHIGFSQCAWLSFSF